MYDASSKLIFSHVEDKKLVEVVEKFPCVYDLANAEYKNQEIKDNAWKEIAECVQRSVEDCKKRWRNIKDTYIKRHKRNRKGTGSTSSKSKSWPLADMLSFLRQVDLRPLRMSNIPSDGPPAQDDCGYVDEIEDDVSTAYEQIEEPPRYDKTDDRTSRINKRQKLEEEIIEMLHDRRYERNETSRDFRPPHDDDIDLFFKSIAMSVKKLRPQLRNEAKLRSLHMIIDLEKRNKGFSVSSNTRTNSSVYTALPRSTPRTDFHNASDFDSSGSS